MSDTVENTVKLKVPEIGIVDLQNVVQIIDAAAERGAFRGNELASVGSVRDRIDAFVKAVSPEALQPDTTANQQAPTAPASYDTPPQTTSTEKSSVEGSSKKKSKKAN